MTRKLFLLPGDGIGPEAMNEVRKLIAFMNENMMLLFIWMWIYSYDFLIVIHVGILLLVYINYIITISVKIGEINYWTTEHNVSGF